MKFIFPTHMLAWNYFSSFKNNCRIRYYLKLDEVGDKINNQSKRYDVITKNILMSIADACNIWFILVEIINIDYYLPW